MIDRVSIGRIALSSSMLYSLTKKEKIIETFLKTIIKKIIMTWKLLN